MFRLLSKVKPIEASSNPILCSNNTRGQSQAVSLWFDNNHEFSASPSVLLSIKLICSTCFNWTPLLSNSVAERAPEGHPPGCVPVISRDPQLWGGLKQFNSHRAKHEQDIAIHAPLVEAWVARERTQNKLNQTLQIN